MSFFHQHPPAVARRRFVFFGMLAPAAGVSAAARGQQKAAAPKSPVAANAPSRKAAPRPRRVFDAHLHCPSESGETWQWHPVTPTFKEFAAYLERTGRSEERRVGKECRSRGWSGS